jgi:PAS domain S-box-containing protein
LTGVASHGGNRAQTMSMSSGQSPKAAAALSDTVGIDAFDDIDQSVLDAIPTGLCACTVDGALTRYNRRAVELWGRAPRLGDPSEQYGGDFRRFKADGAPLPFAATPVGNVLRSGQRIVGAEVVIERPDGSRVPVLMNVAPLKSASGRIQGAVCSFQELTERKRVEEALRASEAELLSVINRTPFMLVRCDRTLHYRFVSQAYAQLVGLRQEDIVGKSIVEAIGPKGLGTLRPHIDKVLAGAALEFDCEIDFANVGPRRLHIAYRPETDAAGKVDGWIASLLDITEQSRAVQAREQLASIVESSGDAIVSKNLGGIIVSWNRAAEALFGYAAGEVIGKSITILIPAELQDEEPEILARVRRGESLDHYETVRQRKDGSRINVSLSVSPVRDARGVIVGASKIARDITVRKRNEANLARRADEQAALYQFTDKLYRATCLPDVYEAALDAILVALHCGRASILRFDNAGAMRFVAWRGLTERYRRTADGHSPWHVGETNPEPLLIGDADTADFSDTLKAVVKHEGVSALAFVPLMASGRLIGKFMAYYDTPRAFAREDVALALTLARQLGFAVERMQAEHARNVIEGELRELSEQLEAEVERRTLERDRIWNVSEDLLGVANFDGHFLSLNPAWSKLLGWTEDEIKAMHVSQLRHPDDTAASEAGRQHLAAGVPTVRMENRFRHRDGTWRWLQWTMTENNGLIYVAGRHVTAEKEQAEALARAERQTAHLQKMEAIGQLTGGVAHDFNNLLMIVSGHAQSLKKRLHEARDMRAVQAIETAANRGENLTRQLLAFSRTLPLDPTVISLSDTVQAIRDVLAGTMHVNIAFSVDVPADTWPVRVDKSELDLALVNLAVNARDAMPDGGTIAIFAENVGLKASDAPHGIAGDYVALRVADTGCGIPPELLPRVVEPFFTTKGPEKGTGLGLSQVYGLAQRSGGAVQIDSAVGRGTTVTVYLPRSSRDIVDAPSPEDASDFAAADQRTILVVEDNKDVKNVAVALLEQLGYRTVAVESAAEALDVLASGQQVSLLFTDVALPGQIDGLALARKVTDRHGAIPVVLTTGYTRVFESDPEFPVLRKPYQIAALGRLIHQALYAPPRNGTAH